MSAASTTGTVGAVWILLCSLAPPVAASPLCSTEQSCGAAAVGSLANLFDRVIQHSARVSGVSRDLHQHFEQQFVPSRNQIGRIRRNCHTATIVTPTDKENAQRMTGEELTEVILKLLVAWREPLWRLQQSLRHHGDLSSQKAVQAGHMVHELRTGVHRVAQQMQTLGRVRNLVTELSSHESPSEGATEWSVLQRSELLHCLRRDSNKVQNYLKILKCRVLPEYGC